MSNNFPANKLLKSEKCKLVLVKCAFVFSLRKYWLFVFDLMVVISIWYTSNAYWYMHAQCTHTYVCHTVSVKNYE